MKPNKRSRAATGSSEASVSKTITPKRARVPSPTPDVMSGDDEGETHKQSADASEDNSSDDDTLLTDLPTAFTRRSMAVPKSPTPPTDAEMDAESESSESEEDESSPKMEVDDEVAKPKTPVKAVRKDDAPPPKATQDKGKGKAREKPAVPDRSLAASKHAFKPGKTEAPRKKITRPFDSSKPLYSEALASPPRDAKKFAAKLLARKKIVVPSSKELEISEEQPWRKPKKVSHPVVHFDYQAPYRSTSTIPSAEIQESPNAIWAIPYGSSECTPDRYQTVLEAVRFLDPQVGSVESIFETERGFYLLKVERQETVKVLLDAKVAMNFRRHRAVFFYEHLQAPQTKSMIIFDSYPEKTIKAIEKSLQSSMEKALIKTIKSLKMFSDSVIAVTLASFYCGKWGELRRFYAVISFLPGLNDPATEAKTIDGIWKWESEWEMPGVKYVELDIMGDSCFPKLRLRLHPVCKLCHSDEHWSDACTWRMDYPALRDWKDNDL
ncbi:hypothetical protein BDR03DRAFT_976121 [Suillus americanus]|nr:hypothetical protein BDR03DRAFT_976121 [Suillus americanus]